MAKKTLLLPSISRVVAGAVAILEMPINPTYHHIKFTATGTALAVGHIGKIRVIVDGKTVQEFKDLTRLIDINAFHGRQADTVTDFMLHFKDDDFNDLAEKRTMAFGTQGLQTFNIEIELAAGFPADGTLKAHAFIDTVPQPLGVFNRIRETSMNSASSGVVEYDKLIRNGAIYKQIHFFKADISRIELEADSNKVIDATKAVLERQQKSVRPVARVPVSAKATHLDFALEGTGSDLFNTTGMNDLRAKLTFDSAGVVEIVTEQLDYYSGQ